MSIKKLSMNHNCHLPPLAIVKIHSGTAITVCRSIGTYEVLKLECETFASKPSVKPRDVIADAWVLYTGVVGDVMPLSRAEATGGEDGNLHFGIAFEMGISSARARWKEA